MPLTRRDLLSLSPAALALLTGCRLGVRSLELDPSQSEAQAFLAAVRRGDLGAVRAALAADATLARAADRQGRSALVLAHLDGHREVAELILEQGHDLDVVEAVLAEDWERVEALVEEQPRRALVAHATGGTLLHAGARCGVPDLYRLRSLGCQPDAAPEGGDGRTPARAAMDCVDADRALIAAQDLLGNGSDPNRAQPAGDSVLHGAVRRRDARLVRLAIRKGGAVDARDHRGRRPLDLAEELEWEAGVRLLRAHASIPRDNRLTRLALDASRQAVTLPDLSDIPQERQSAITGASHARLERLRELVGEDSRLVFSVSTDEELAIEACGHTGMRDIIRWHLDRGAPLSLPTAISLGDLGFARFLLDRSPEAIHERGPHDFPLSWYPAIGGGSVEAAELLLSRGLPLEQESAGTTALHQAAMRGRLELVDFLIERGADLEAVGYRQDPAGQTPLQLARAEGRDEVVRLLVDRGALG